MRPLSVQIKHLSWVCLGDEVSIRNGGLPSEWVGPIQSAEGLNGTKDGERDFPGGSEVKNPPANAVDTSFIPGPGRYHMLGSN